MEGMALPSTAPMTLANPLNLEAEVERRADTITPLEHTAVAVYSVPGVEAEAVVLHRAKAAMEAHGVLIRQGMALAVRLEHQMGPLAPLEHRVNLDAVMAEVAEVTERHLELAEQAVLEVRQAVEQAEAEAQQMGKLGLERQAALEPSEFIVGR